MKLNAIILIGCMVLSYGCSRNLDKQLFVDLCESKVRIPTEMQVIKDGSLQNMSVDCIYSTHSNKRNVPRLCQMQFSFLQFLQINL